jgi:thiamine-monophosphate kinase
MPVPDLLSRLRFYYIIDCEASLSVQRQTEIAISAGATIIQYRNKHFTPGDFEALETVRKICRTSGVPFVINDDIMMARAVDADGVHLGQSDADHALARRILGGYALIGASVSTLDELAGTDLTDCDYIGAGPVFFTSTKPDASPVIGIEGLAAVVGKSPLPVVAIGGINAENAGLCLSSGAAGVAVISTISRAKDPMANATALAGVCGCPPRTLKIPWKDEFELINRFLSSCDSCLATDVMTVPPGDDAALFSSIARPVFTTDTQRDGIHFRRYWQEMEEIGKRAVEITLSDLAASYAKPVAFFVNLCIPPEMAEQDVVELYKGIDAALTLHGTALAGGNLSLGPVFALDLFAAGDGKNIFPLRSAAIPGDGLYVTGPLGLARSGLQCLLNDDLSFSALINKYKFPKARFDAAEILFSHGVACVMDISDGLCGDASHIAAASGVTVQFEPSALAIDPDLASYCKNYGLDPVRQALAGGDDYELLFACSPEVFEKISIELPGAHQVGRIVPRGDRLCTGAPEGTSSYRHGGVSGGM